MESSHITLNSVLQSIEETKYQPDNREIHQKTSVLIGEYLNNELTRLQS